MHFYSVGRPTDRVIYFVMPLIPSKFDNDYLGYALSLNYLLFLEFQNIGYNKSFSDNISQQTL